MNRHFSRSSLAFFIFPGACLLLLLLGWPIVQSAVSSLSEQSSSMAGSAQFVGLAHFKTLLSQSSFWNSLWLAVSFTVSTTLIELTIATAIALFLYFQKPVGRLLEVLLILPMFVLPVVSGLTFRYIYDPNDGPLSVVFRYFNFEPFSPLADSFWSFWAIVFQDVWRMWPFLFLVIYAGLKALPKSAQEAARIDGASNKALIWHIVLPSLRPTLAIAVGLKVMESLKVFTEVYVMTGGGPGDSTSLISLFVVKQAFHFFQIGPASAASMVLLALGMSLAWTVTKIQSQPTSTSG